MPLKVARLSCGEGNTVEASSPEQNGIDLVIIPSLQQCSTTDEYKWLDPKTLPGPSDSRLITFQYPECENDWWEIQGQGSKLLQELHHERIKTNRRYRPILFICHSFGSIIAKEALLDAQSEPMYNQMFDYIAGFIFLGSIHNARDSELKKSVIRCVATEKSISTTHQAFKSSQFDKFISSFQGICTRFASACGAATVSIYELNKTPVKKYAMSRAKILVTQSLVRLGTRSKTHGVEQNHKELSETLVPDSPASKFVLQELKSIVEDAVCQCQSQMPKSPQVGKVLPGAGDDPRPKIHQVLASHVRLSDVLPPKNLSETQTRHVNLPCRLIRPYQENLAFVGRDSTLDQIDAVLRPKSGTESRQCTFALNGLGGMGKTQTALAYVFRSWDLFQAILWVRADSREKMLYSFADFAYELGLIQDNISDQNAALNEVKKWFESTDVPWLVVFDNADTEDDTNLQLLQDFWPTAKNGSVLITTQDINLAVTFAQEKIQLERLTAEDAIKLLFKGSGQTYTPATKENAAQIVERVDRLPLAINQAARLIQTEGLDFRDFLVLYDKTTLIQASDPDRAPAHRYDHSLQTVWNVAFQTLKQDLWIGKLVNIIAFLDTEKILESMLSDGVEKSNDKRLSFLKGPRNFILYRSKLIRSGLVYRNEGLGMLWMHGLVQETCHMRMSHEERQEAFELATMLLQAGWPVPEMHNRRQNSLWAAQQELASHVVRLAQIYKSSNSRSSTDLHGLQPDERFAQLLYNAGWYFVERDFLPSAEALLTLAKEICEASIKDPELILADIYGAFGGIDSERNELHQTLENFQKQYDYLQRAFKKNLLVRPNVREALALGGLAQGHAGLDELPEAEEYFKRCISVWENCPGDPTIYQSHLGTCLAFQGKLADADKILGELIKARANKFGPQDTTSYRTGLLYYALGNVRRKEKKFDEAYAIEKACLLMWQKTCGQDHHYTAEAYYKVAWHLQRKKEYQGAIDMYKQALLIYEKDAMLYKNEIARVKYMLGTTYQQSGSSETGQHLLRDAEALGKSIKGPDWVQVGEESYDAIVSFWSR